MSGHFEKGAWIEDPKPLRYNGLKGMDLINSIQYAYRKHIVETGQTPDTLCISFPEYEELRYFIQYQFRSRFSDVGSVLNLTVVPSDCKDAMIQVFKKSPIVKVRA